MMWIQHVWKGPEILLLECWLIEQQQQKKNEERKSEECDDWIVGR